MTLERRKFDRMPCYLIAKQSEEDGGEEDFFGIVRNISSGGAMIEADHRLDVGTPMSLAFLLEDGREIWEAKGRVVWSRRTDEKTIFGLQFTEPLEENWQSSLL